MGSRITRSATTRPATSFRTTPHWTIHPAYKDWIVDAEPPEGDYPYGTELDLTFVPPRQEAATQAHDE